MQEEIHRYLRVTHSTLEIDFYNFDWYVHVFNFFSPERHFCKIDDISYGKENTPVSCVNSLDNNYPEYVEYSTVRIPQKGVQIPLDEGFLTCCDCTGKKHALKKYDQFALNTGCFWGSTASNITPDWQFHEIVVTNIMNKLIHYYC